MCRIVQVTHKLLLIIQSLTFINIVYFWSSQSLIEGATLSFSQFSLKLKNPAFYVEK